MSSRRLLRRAEAYRRAGDEAAAARLYAQALEAGSQDPATAVELGEAYAESGDDTDADAAFQRALALSESPGTVALDIAERLRRRGRSEHAVDYFRRALELGGGERLRALTGLGYAAFEQGDAEEAALALRQARVLAPNDPFVAYNLALALETHGERSEVEALYEAALAQRPELYEAWQRLAHVRRFERADDALIRRMRALADDPDTSAHGRERLGFALAKALDDCGDGASAFGYATQANALKRRRLPAFDDRSHWAAVTRVAQVFTRERADALALTPADDGPTPVFIVGMPRSGTTLVERWLASHPRVAAGGERQTLPRLVAERLAGYPESLTAGAGHALAAVREAYQAGTRELAGGARWVTDKLPANFVHIGLIRALFPEARIIHCRRNAMDTGLSIYFQDFDTGHAYANDLTDIARYYRGYRWLMQRWHARFPCALTSVWYERLATRPHGEQARLLQALGLTPDSVAESGGPVSDTASLWQVREPVHGRSVRRWRAYARALEPLRRGLLAPDEDL